MDRVELLGIFYEIVRVAHDEIKPYGFDEIFATQKMKLNPPIAAAISYAESVFHITEAMVSPPARVDLVEKDRFS